MEGSKAKQNLPGQGFLFNGSNEAKKGSVFIEITNVSSANVSTDVAFHGDTQIGISGSHQSQGASRDIILYPSNWLYNASVIGFLKVIAKGEGEKYVEKEILQQDGSVKLNTDLFTDIVKLGDKDIPKIIKYLVDFIDVEDDKISNILNKKDKNLLEFLNNLGLNNISLDDDQVMLALKYYLVGNKLFAKNQPNQNLVSFNEWRYLEFPKLISEIFNRKRTHIKCELCGEDLQGINSKSNLEKRLTTFQLAHFNKLGPSSKDFPNSFWNLRSSLRICFLCSYLMIHHHFALLSTKGNKNIFVNAPSFKIMWYLNKFAEKIIKREGVDLKKILGISLLDLSQRIHATIGAWSLMNIEMVVITGNEVHYYSLPYEIASILLDKEIASLIKQAGEPIVLEKILSGDFDSLLYLNYRIMRCLTNWKGKCMDEYLSDLNNKGDFNRLKELTGILPLLYAKISEYRNNKEGAYYGRI